jgi:hypothetical protein
MVKLVDTCRNFGRSAALHPHRAVRPLTFSPCRFRWRSHHHPDGTQRIRTGRHQGHQGHRSRHDHQGQRSHQRSRQLRADSHNPSTSHEPRATSHDHDHDHDHDHGRVDWPAPAMTHHRQQRLHSDNCWRPEPRHVFRSTLRSRPLAPHPEHPETRG